MLDISNKDETLCRDVYPAEVALPDGSVLTNVRVFATTHRLLVFKDGAGRTIEPIIDEPLVHVGSVPASMDTLRPGAGRLECTLNSGTAWVNAGRGCGCGSPLKALSSPIPWVRRRK